MKATLLTLLAILIAVTLAADPGTGKSLLFADSYLLRATGAEANYWNPALLARGHGVTWLPLLNTGIIIANNSLDLDLYNYVMSVEDTLTAADKDKILNAIDEKLALNAEAQISVFGITTGRIGLTSTLQLAAEGAFSEDYLELLLKGNPGDSLHIDFTNQDNYGSATAYVDFTFGMGDFRIPTGGKFGPVRLGASLSLLGGLVDAYTRDYSGEFESSLEGLTLKQNVTLRTAGIPDSLDSVDPMELAGFAGLGYKAMLGAAWDPLPNLSVGLSLDNILGRIRWTKECRQTSYVAEIEDVYLTDLDSLEVFDDPVDMEIAAYTTKFPLELRLGGMYTLPRIGSFSADLLAPLQDSDRYRGGTRLSLGAEFNPLPWLPVYLGWNLGNKDYPWRFSYGLGLETGLLEFGLGVQCIESVIPGYSSKGLALGVFFTLGA